MSKNPSDAEAMRAIADHMDRADMRSIALKFEMQKRIASSMDKDRALLIREMAATDGATFSAIASILMTAGLGQWAAAEVDIAGEAVVGEAMRVLGESATDQPWASISR